MLEKIDNRLCIQASVLIDSGVITKSNYDKMKNKGHLIVRRRGCLGTPAMVDLYSMPERYKRQVDDKFGDTIRSFECEKLIEKRIVEDPEAMKYFSEYKTPTGNTLKPDQVMQYYNNAIVLNAIHQLINERHAMYKKLGNRKLPGKWETIANELAQVDAKRYPHNLNQNPRRLKEKYDNYMTDGYGVLVHGNFANNNARVVTERLEMLILSIYGMKNKPYAKWVYEDYHRFLAGDLLIVDTRTGEIFDRDDFFDDDKGCYKTISEATCWNIINNPKNRAIVDRIRSSYHRYNSVSRPHYHRHAPEYGLSKVSLDDRDLPRKMHDGNRVKAYYAYDVASGCIIGASYSVKKDTTLFIDCLRDMFRFIDSRGWGLPLEMEVENHLVNQYEDDLMKAGVVFPLVRWCAPTNSQEKHAEQFNRRKKYGFEKRYQGGIGRWYASQEANRTEGERVYDEATNKYIIKEKTYTFEQLVADDLYTIEMYNNSWHRNQDRYRGLTCMQVLEQNLNPNLARINRPLLVRYIGDNTRTSIQRNMYVQVQYADYQLPNPEVLGKLLPNNYTVEAYYMPGDKIEKVFLYQKENFICEATRIETFNTSNAEFTEKDREAKTAQAKYIAQFDSMGKQGVDKLANVDTLPNLDIMSEVAAAAVEVPVPAENTELCDEDYTRYFDSEWSRQHAINSL